LRPKRRLHQAHRVGRQQPQAEGKQRRLGIAQRVDLARQGLGRLEEESLDCPTLAVYFCHTHRRHLVSRQIRQDMDLRVALACRLVQGHRDATDYQHLPDLVSQAQALLVDPSRLTAALGFPLPEQFAAQAAVLAQDEETATAQDPPEQSQGAEVAVRNPHVARANQRVDRLQQRTLLRVAILRQEHVRDGQVLLVQDPQDEARQREGPGQPQLRQAVFGSREMIAVEELDPVTGQQGRQRSPQGANDGSDAPCRLVDKSRRNPKFNVLEFVVNGLVTNRELVLEGAVGGMDRRLLAKDNTT